MKKKLLLASLAGAVILAGTALLVLTSRSPVEAADPLDRPPQRGTGESSSQQLPISQVVLFSSGVGHFQRQGQVQGSARVDLSFPVSDINDLLKSLVVQDLSGGHVAAVSYDANAPVERTLQSFAINLQGNPSLAGLLNQARGEKIEVVLQQAQASQPGTLTGTLVGIEKQQQAQGKDTVTVELLNLWCADGLRSLKLADLQRVRFLNPLIESELRQALETLALAHDTQKKTVSLHLSGQGERQVRVGYVIESPIWKTSYRLVLDQAGQGRPYLQGWAIVENPSDEDWKEVRMALISGRPISFQMDLYQQLFVPRPVVEPELFASLRPVAYSGGIGGESDRPLVGGLGGAPQEEAKGNFEQDKKRDSAEREALNGFMGRGTDGRLKDALRKELQQQMDLGSSVTSVASASKLGDYFQYVIDRPVTLHRQKSALLPIVGKDVQATRLSIYNQATQAKFPLLGLRLKNTTGLHLMQGPITVFEGSVYAGDARILDLQPQEERLLSYAVDLGTEVDAVAHSDNGKLTSVKIVKGLIQQTTRLRESKSYTITNRNDQERLVLIEHPVRHDFKLIDTEKPVETASDFYRFEVPVAAGKSATHTVSEERTLSSTLVFSNINDQQIRIFLSSPAVSEPVKQAFSKAQSLRWEAAKTQREISEQQRQLNTIVQDQGRLRANLKEMPSTAAAYKRYLEKFDQQETQIEAYQAKIKELQTLEHSQQKALEDYLASLNVE